MFCDLGDFGNTRGLFSPRLLPSCDFGDKMFGDLGDLGDTRGLFSP